MFGFHHLFDNGMTGLCLMAVLVIFIGSVAIAIYLTFTNKTLSSQNFTYVATVVAGLVLSVAAGILGQPAKLQVSSTPPTSFALPGVQPVAPSTQDVQVRVATDQISEFRTLYAWVYIIAGLLCLLVFVIPTNSTHEIVKGVALTMLGFLVTMIGTVAPNNPVRQASEQMANAPDVKLFLE